MSLPRMMAPGTAGRRVAIALVLLLVVVVDAFLVVAALNRAGHVPQAASTPPPSLVATPEPTKTPGKEEPEKEPAEEADPQAVPANRFISPLTATDAWRTAAGSCPDGAVVAEFTADGGATWQPFDVTATTGAAQALRIEAVDLDYAFLVTLDQGNCGPQFSATYTGGLDWEAYTDERLLGSWFVRPDAPEVVVSPTGRQQAPCNVAALAPRDEVEAAVLCSDHRVFRTFDAAQSWDGGVEITGAAAIADAPDGYLVASTGLDECEGVGVLAIPSAASDETIDARGCAELQAEPGELAVGVGEGAIWLWAADSVARSVDGGASWE